MLSELNPFHGLTQESIAMGVKNSGGTGSTLLVPQQCFETLVCKQIMLMQPFAMHALDRIKNELAVLFEASLPQDLEYFPELRTFVVDVLDKHLDDAITNTRVLVENAFAMETARVNISHPDFERARDEMFSEFGRIALQATSDQQRPSTHPTQSTTNTQATTTQPQPPPQIRVDVLPQRETPTKKQQPPHQQPTHVHAVFEDILSNNTNPKPKPKPTTRRPASPTPTENHTTNSSEIQGAKIMAGAGAAGLAVGSLVVGPVVGVAAGMGTAAAVLRGDNVGDAARTAGKVTLGMYDATTKAVDLGSRAKKRALGWGASLGQNVSENTAENKNANNVPQSKLIVPSAEEILSTHERACDLVAALIDMYFRVVRIKMQDMIPKVIFAFAINPVSQNMEIKVLHAVLSSPLGQLSNVTQFALASVPTNEKQNLNRGYNSQNSELLREKDQLEEALRLMDLCKQPTA